MAIYNWFWNWEISYRYRSKDMYHSYEEALLEGIKEAVKILKDAFADYCVEMLNKK
jgi:hypothetical protein